MAQTKPEVEWFYDPRTYFREWGLMNLAGKWAVVRAEDFNVNNNYKVVSPWVEQRQTAMGFLKLLKEQ